LLSNLSETTPTAEYDYDETPAEFLELDRTYLQQRIPKVTKKRLPFDSNHRKPKLSWERMSVYSVDKSTAPRRNYVFVCERPNIHRHVSTMEPNEPLQTPHTEAVDLWKRGDRGMMMCNRLDICHHYEIRSEDLDRFVGDAHRRGIKTNYYPPDGSIKRVAQDGHYLFLCNGGDFQGVLQELDLPTIANDLFKNKDDPKLVPKMNKRGNRGPSLIFTGSQSLTRGPRSQFAKASLSAGSKRYWPAYVTMSKAMREVASYRSDTSDEPFPVPFQSISDMPLRKEKWAAQMHPDCDIESCNFLIYISEFEFSAESIDRLISHTDGQNGKRHGWDYLATFWEFYFDSTLCRWILMVASVTSRGSIEEYHTREGKVGNATDLLMKNYNDHPEWQRRVIPSSLCPATLASDHRVTSIHYDTLVFLSPVLWHIHKMRRYWLARGRMMSKYLAIEMLVGFFKSNNPLRFHRFAESVYGETVTTGRIGIPRDSTFLREFERHMFVTYGSWNGTKDRMDQAAGAMRTQPCTIHPQTDWAQDSALVFWLGMSKEVSSKFKYQGPSDADFVRCMRDIKKEMIGLGDLFSQKLLFAAAAIGLDIPISFFEHCLPGSSQHMKVLRKAPYSFSRPDQVKQLVTSLSVKMNVLPEVAEEVVCLGLKGDLSLSLYKEVSIKGCDLFSAVYNKERLIEIRRLDNNSKRDMVASRGGFSELATSGYYPDWAKFKDVTKYCLNHVRMSSETNFTFSTDRSTPSQIKVLEKEVVHFESPEVNFEAVQGLLHSSKYLHMSDPVSNLADYLQVSREFLISKIKI
jgi:hypothetical protein